MTPARDAAVPVAHNRLETARPPVVVTAPRPVARTPWWARPAVILTLVVVGVGLRAAHLAGGRNLWIDESMLALNLVDRGPADLLRPLDWNQGAPVGFLLAVKAVVTQLGPGEWALRLVPFAGSLLGLVAFAWLAPRLMPRPAAALAVALYALSPGLVSYAAECKQYATDAALTVGLFAAAAGLLTGKGGAARWGIAGAAGAAAVWFSHPVAFVLGGIGGALLADAAARRDRVRFLAAAVTSAAWLASFAACYVLFTRHLRGNEYLLGYWAGHFLPLPPRTAGDFAWLAEHYFAPFDYPAGLGGTEVRAGGLAAVFFAVGLWNLARERWPVALAVALPALLALAASGLHAYPFTGRLLLFLVPLLVLGVARGAWAVAAALRPAQPAAATAVLGVLLAAVALETYQGVRHPPREEQLAPVLDAVRAELRPGDRVYVYYGAVPAFLHYTRDNPFPPGVVTLGTEARANRTEYRDQLAAFAGHPRVWLVFSHRHQHEETVITAYAEGLGRGEKVAAAAGAAAYRFDLSARP